MPQHHHLTSKGESKGDKNDIDKQKSEKSDGSDWMDLSHMSGGDLYKGLALG